MRTHWFCGLLCALGGWLWLPLALAAAPASAPEQPMSVLSAADTAQLRRALAASAPADAGSDVLRRHYAGQVEAATRLGEPVALERVLRAAVARLPGEARWANDLGALLIQAGRLDEAQKLLEAAVATAPNPSEKLFYESNLMRVLVERGAPGAEERIAQVRRAAEAMLGSTPPSADRVRVLRALGAAASAEGERHMRRAQLAEVLAARAESERWYREALDVARALPGPSQRQATLASNNLATAQRERAVALMRLGRHAEAQRLLDEHMRFLQQQPLPGSTVAGAHQVLAALRLFQGEFAEAERQLRLSLLALDRLHYTGDHPARVSKLRDLLLVLWLRGQHAAALRELAAFDAKVGADSAAAKRMPFERALVYLSNGRARDAAPLFEGVARYHRAGAGAGHFYTAQALGLQGAALWIGGEQATRERAAELLKDAVLDMTSPRNADFLDDSGSRKAVRQLIFTTYLEAMAWRGGLQAMVAMGVADRLLSGSTGQAIADAALRAAANDPALAALVRQEQDARNELQGLQQALQDAESAFTKDDAERTRSRIAELELQRQQVHERIQARYPGYERLLRPALPNPTEVAQRLKRDEVLVLAMPTERALYVWAVSADELPAFARVEVGAARLGELVQRLRKGLDFGNPGGRSKTFDTTAAHELYRQVLAPVAARLQNRQHLIVATSGALARLPFAVMLTAAPGAAEPPWLVHKLATSYVPNVAAWLSLRQMPPSQPAAEALIAWADPAFKHQRAAVAVAASGPRKRDALADEDGAQRASPRYEELPALPETRDEVRAIAVALKSDAERDMLWGARATRESVLAANRSGQLARKRVVVFATHGLTAGDLPGLTQPALALASSEAGKGPLAALFGLDDVLSLKLNADWVVLSACNTAAADGRAGEALSGLARGFLYAGARSLLVTHWAVETESAKLLTTGTFEAHAAGKTIGKAESLRQAMLKVMAQPKYSQPAYWAPFVLVGDGAR